MSQQDLLKPEVFFTSNHSALPIPDLVTAQLAGNTKPITPWPQNSVVGASTTTVPPSRNKSALLANIKDDLTIVPEEGWSILRTPFHPSRWTAISSVLPSAEVAMANRRSFAVTLQQMSAAYSFTHPNLSDQSIGNAFAGVTNANANSPHSDAASAADNLRLVENYNRYFSYGLDQLIAFSRTRSGSITKSSSGLLNTDGSSLPLSTSTLSANSFVASPFAQLQPFRDQPHIAAIVRELTNTDVATNLQYIKSGSSYKGQPLYFVLDPSRQFGYGFSAGARLEASNTTRSRFLVYCPSPCLRQTAPQVLF
jgi:hypothetical protein